MSHRKSLHILGILCVYILSACVSAGNPAQPGTLHVLAAETFLADIARNVAGDRLKVDSLLPAGLDPHEFQPAPQDAIQISQSDVLIVNGLGYETWLTKSLQDAGGQHLLVTATHGLASSPDPTGGHPDGDPHLWMDPSNVIHYVENIRDGLSQADPAGKAIYSANADAYITKLQDLDSSIRSQVAQIPPARRKLVTNHDALAYFAQAYGLQIVGAVIPSVTNEASPSAQQMDRLIDSIKRSGAPAIFLDASENPNLAGQISSATGAKLVTNLYVETLSAPDGPAPTYLAMLQHDTAAIVNALK
jgi:ABC-type Zn uptake system ZnuABC Zn-binding protein ZnuA